MKSRGKERKDVMKILRKVFWLGLLVAMLSIVSWAGNCLAENATVKDSGTDGNIHWEILEVPDSEWGHKTTLALSGNGDMRDYNEPLDCCPGYVHAPWIIDYYGAGSPYGKYYNNITIGEGITRIGTYAFYSQGRYMSSIHEIVIPSTVKSIGTGALTEMGYVDQIVIPDTVETIEKGAIKSTYRIICSSGSEAYRYAKENNNPITLSDLSVTLETTRLDLKTGETATLRVTVTPDQYKPVFSSSNTGVATVDEAGLVTAVGQGYASITVTTGTDRQSCAVYVTDPPKPYAIKYMLRGGTNHPANPDTLAEGEKLTLLNPTREDYVFDGWYLREIVETNYAWGWVGYRYEDPVKTLTGVPDQSVTVYASWTKLDVQSPQKMKLTNKTGRKLSISIEKVKNVKGYEVEYSYSSSFPKKKTTLKEIKKNKLSVSGLKKGKTCYVRVRAWAKDSTGKKIYSPWCDTKSVKIKK